jgi:hypothetical protein
LVPVGLDYYGGQTTNPALQTSYSPASNVSKKQNDILLRAVPLNPKLQARQSKSPIGGAGAEGLVGSSFQDSKKGEVIESR